MKLYWQTAPDSRYFDGQAEVTASDTKLVIAVTQDRAMDSRNETFTCEAHVSKEEAEALYALLGQWLGKPPHALGAGQQ